jgi:PAS domain S-box-containing protein
LIETVPDAMAITDVDGNVRRINGPWLDLFGYGADDGRAKNRDVTSTESRELS